MNKFVIITIAALFCIPVLAQDDIEVLSKIDSLCNEITILKQQNSIITNDNSALKKRIVALESTIKELQGESEAISNRVTDTEVGLVNTESSIRDTKSGLESKIMETNGVVSDQTEIIKKKSIWGVIIAFFVLSISAILTLLLNKKGNDRIEALQGKAEKLNEEIVGRLTSEVNEIQKISSSIGTLSSSGVSTQNEQDLIKALADRITFMEMTLYKMDPSVRGYKQLTKSISQMKNNLLANGYELVDMLGKPYHEGMKVTANFVEDENIEQGQQIITGIIKPQINYQGQMIQSAQITVSQNI